MPRRLPDKHSQGLRCRGARGARSCGITQARCAYNYPCCAECTHFPDPAEPVKMRRRFVCMAADCGIEFEAMAIGKQQRLCSACRASRGRAAVKESRRKRAETSVELATAPAPAGDTWWASATGMTHLWGSSAAVSHCGGSRDRTSPVPLEGWPQNAYCNRCLRIAGVRPIGRELDRPA